MSRLGLGVRGINLSNTRARYASAFKQGILAKEDCEPKEDETSRN